MNKGITNATEQLRKALQTAQGKSYAVTAVTILMVLIIFVFGIFPAISAILFQSEQNAKRMEALAAINTKHTTLKNLAVEESKKRAVSLALRAALPNDMEQDMLVEQFYEMASLTETELLSIQMAEIGDQEQIADAFILAEPLDSLAVSLTFRGTRSQLEELLNELEQMRRIFNIRDLQLSNETNADATYRMSVAGEIYFWVLPE